jgi:flagellar L-ring protein precursor FlgH
MKTASKSASKLALAALLLATSTSALLAQSLWSGRDQSMFADRKAARTGDILTVLVSESAAATNSQSKSSSRESSIDDAVSRFFFDKGLTHGGQLPSLSLGGKSSNSGGGEVSNNQSLTSRAAVLVTDVMPNGNLVIQGVRIVTFSGETQYVVLHGLVRPDDIAPSNTVLSSNIADARVEFVAEGNLSDAQKRGWLARVYETLRPF